MKGENDETLISSMEATASDAIETGQHAFNRLGVLARGSLIALLANETLLATVHNDALTRGDIALMVGSDEQSGADIAFDDLDVWNLADQQQEVIPSLTNVKGTPLPSATPTSGLTQTPNDTPTPPPTATQTPIPSPTFTPTPAPYTLDELSFDWTPLA